MENDDLTIISDTKRIKGTGLLIKKALLLTVSEEHFGQCYVLKKESLIIGRDPGCDMVIADKTVSSRHCRIDRDEKGNHYIEDLESSNGTFLNRKRIKKRSQIYYSDRIVLGDTILRYYLEEKLR